MPKTTRKITRNKKVKFVEKTTEIKPAVQKTKSTKATKAPAVQKTKSTKATKAPAVQKTKSTKATKAPAVQKTKSTKAGKAPAVQKKDDAALLQTVKELLKKDSVFIQNETFKTLIEEEHVKTLELERHLDQLSKLCKERKKHMRKLKVQTMKMESMMIKKESKKLKKKNKKVNGFTKPRAISNELTTFLTSKCSADISMGETDKHAMLSQTDVTKLLHKYIQDKKLQNKSNGQIIIPDRDLKDLLKFKTGELTYFNLQTYMKQHYPKLQIPTKVFKTA